MKGMNLEDFKYGDVVAIKDNFDNWVVAEVQIPLTEEGNFSAFYHDAGYETYVHENDMKKIILLERPE